MTEFRSQYMQTLAKDFTELSRLEERLKDGDLRLVPQILSTIPEIANKYNFNIKSKLTLAATFIDLIYFCTYDEEMKFYKRGLPRPKFLVDRFHTSCNAAMSVAYFLLGKKDRAEKLLETVQSKGFFTPGTKLVVNSDKFQRNTPSTFPNALVAISNALLGHQDRAERIVKDLEKRHKKAEGGFRAKARCQTLRTRANAAMAVAYSLLGRKEEAEGLVGLIDNKIGINNDGLVNFSENNSSIWTSANAIYALACFSVGRHDRAVQNSQALDAIMPQSNSLFWERTTKDRITTTSNALVGAVYSVCCATSQNINFESDPVTEIKSLEELQRHSYTEVMEGLEKGKIVLGIDLPND